MDPQIADKVVDAGDGRIVSFPGSMGDEDIAKALRPAAPDNSEALARTAKPTQFENERQPSRQPGVTQSLLSEVGNAIKSVPDIIRGAANPATTARRGAALFEHDQDRAATRSPAYRAVADVGEAAGINAPGMEHDADIGNRRGIVGKATGDALMLTGPSAIHTGFEAARGRFPNYKAPEPRPFDADRAFNRTAIGGMIDLLGPSPTVGKAAAAAGTGLATEAVPWLVNKAARSKPVVNFMTKRPGPGAGEGRVPLWKQAGIQEGQRPLGQSVDVTYVPEPTPRPKPQVQSLGRDAYNSHYPSEPKGPPSDFETREAPKPYTELEEAPEDLRPKPAPPTGDPVSRAAGETKNLAADMEQAAVAKPAAVPESVSATDGKPTPPVLPDVVNGKALPISDTAKDAFQRFVKSKGKEGPLAPKQTPKPKGISRRSDMQDDQAVRQEIEQRTQVRPKEPGRKGKAELAEEFKRGKRMDINVDVASKSLTDRLKELPDLWADEGVDADSMLRPADPRLLAEIEQFKKETGRKTAPIKEFNKWRDKKK